MWSILKFFETKDLLKNINRVNKLATTIALSAKKDTIVVTKSIVLDGTNGSNLIFNKVAKRKGSSKHLEVGESS